jgi:eukaryotic-like serine/threonine-protein kinase
MVTADRQVKLIDFGLTIPYTPEFCAPGNRTGTLDYLAPEVMFRSATDHRVDLFALGVTATELITGKLPWERQENSEKTIRMRMNSPPRNPKDLMPSLDPALAKILLKAVSRDPKERFPSAGAFRDAVKATEWAG